MEASSETQSPQSDLVSSRDVDGTEVYDLEGTHIGTVDHFMIDKASGKVRYAVVSFGGIFGLGAEHFSIPWKKLAYDVSLGGYQTPLREDEVSSAPKTSDPDRPGRDWEAQLHHHYGVPAYWA